MKKITSLITATAIVFTAVCINVNAQEAPQSSGLFYETEPQLYAHAVAGANDTEAWVGLQCEHDDDLNEVNENNKYFFLPSSASETEVELKNESSKDIEINGSVIRAGETNIINYEIGESYTVDLDSGTVNVCFMRSTAEAAVYVNNSNTDGKGGGLISFLSPDKSNSTKARGALVDSSGNIDNTPIKKIKGRGNTTWQKSKKPFNITYESKVSVAGMPKSKKYSLLANYQDDSLSRNRILYDLSDAVGIPYASDSRYVDLYIDGYYWGAYQMAEKIEAGSSNLVNDIEETDYLDTDGTVKNDFPFVCEIDPSANSDDYTVSCKNNTKLTIKSPELEPGDVGYDEVKAYVKSKFNDFIYACANPDSTDLSECGDIDSLTKLYLINELGKNWDSGVSSIYFTYKQSSDGTYKFFGSPVWDYDNSLGNAVGVKDDLRQFGVSDYTKYTGWWCRYKGKKKGSNSSTNIMNNLATNDYILNAAPAVWFEEFVPALEHFSGKTIDEIIEKELYTRDEYYKYISGSAAMNYKSGWLLNTGDWISDHSSMNDANFDENTKEFTELETKRQYPQTFEGMYNYCCDWLMNRAAWLSGQMAADYYSETFVMGDVNMDGVVDSADVLLILRASSNAEKLTDDQLILADVNGDTSADSADALAVLRYTVGFIDEGVVIGITK